MNYDRFVADGRAETARRKVPKQPWMSLTVEFPGFRGFVLASYKPDKEMLKDLENKAASRPLLRVEKLEAARKQRQTRRQQAA